MYPADPLGTSANTMHCCTRSVHGCLGAMMMLVAQHKYKFGPLVRSLVSYSQPQNALNGLVAAPVHSGLFRRDGGGGMVS